MNPVINLVFLKSYPWTIGAGWAVDLESMGLLGSAFGFQAGNEEELVKNLITKRADITIFVCGDTHLSFLHNTEFMADLIRSIPGNKVCLCWEAITHSRFPGSKELAFRAMDVFDSFGYSDELDYEFFRLNFPRKAHFFCPFAATADNYKENLRPYGQKRKEVLFFGKFSTFQISEEIYKERRHLLSKLITKDWFKMVDHIDTTSSITVLRDGIDTFLFGIHLPSNNHHGFTPRAFEVIASGSILLHPSFDPHLTPRALNNLIPWVHYVPYNINEDFLSEIEEVIQNFSHDRYETMRLLGMEHVRQFHSVKARVRQIIDLS